MDINNTSTATIISFTIFNSETYGVKWTGNGDSTFFDAAVVNSGGVGLYMTDCSALGMGSFTVDDNGSHGIEMVSGCNDNEMFGVKAARNGGSGLKITATSDKNMISAFTGDSNTSYGIEIANANCDNNVIGTSVLVSNGAGQFTNAGTGTKLRGTIGSADVG
jgi:hypothetical protein